jgi:pimeloyl-ACP methyl ester carboxylesterase
MPTFTRDDLTLHYEERGNPAGPPVVLLHGLTLSSLTMERLAASLYDHRVLLLDLHGHGQSTKPHDPGRYLVSEFADDVVALLDHLGIEQAVIGGLSLGANVSYEVALHHPERVRALVLQMPVFARGVTFGRAFFAALAALFTGLYPVLTPWHPIIRRIPVPSRAHELAFVRNLLASDHLAQAALLWGILRQDAPAKDADTLAPLQMPVLVAAHAYDPLHSIDDASELAEDLSDAQQVRLRSILDYGLRHGEINRVVGSFLRSLPPPQRSSEPPRPATIVSPGDTLTAGRRSEEGSCANTASRAMRS